MIGPTPERGQMGYARLVPERTIDSLLAAEAIRHDPYALIWSPSPRATNPVDHLIRGAYSKLAVFECKSVVERGGDRWDVPIDVDQLMRYRSSVRGYTVPVVYVFPVKPDVLEHPNVRECTIDRCRYGPGCEACCRDARSWGDQESHVMQSSPLVRLQPWFCHWAWAIRADVLARQIRIWDVRTDEYYLNVENMVRSVKPHGTRLCHFLSGIHRRRFDDWLVDLENGSRLLDDVRWPLLTDDPEATPPVFGRFDVTA
ncbi:hypothetical protein [Nocardia asiatica]|uniref:hypothetical protein n=1 Tax=Nocardia asiatica TaxID=209252 RepID=UPI003EDEA626